MAGLNGNIPESILMDFAYIFGWDIDFIFDIKGGNVLKYCMRPDM